MKNQITIILFKIWPINRFWKAKSCNFHFHKNDVTCLLVQMADWPWRIMGARRTTDSWKNPSSSYYIGFIYCWRRVFQWSSRLSLNPPTSPLQGCAKKHPFCRKWNIIWGWSPPQASFYYCLVDKSKSQAHFDNFDGFRENDKKMLKTSMTARAMALDGGYISSGNKR